MTIRRWASPSFMGLAICLFFLPWIEIRCDRGTLQDFSLGVGVAETSKPAAPNAERSPQRESILLASQSGWQSILGDTTTPPELEVVMKEAEKQRACDGLPESHDRETKAAPLMGVYAACLAFGSVCSLLLRKDRQRRRLALLFSLSAALMLAVQIALTFPLVTELVEEDRPSVLTPMSWRYTPWFWTAVSATAAALVSSIIDIQISQTHTPDESCD